MTFPFGFKGSQISNNHTHNHFHADLEKLLTKMINLVSRSWSLYLLKDIVTTLSRNFTSTEN